MWIQRENKTERSFIEDKLNVLQYLWNIHVVLLEDTVSPAIQEHVKIEMHKNLVFYRLLLQCVLVVPIILYMEWTVKNFTLVWVFYFYFISFIFFFNYEIFKVFLNFFLSSQKNSHSHLWKYCFSCVLNITFYSVRKEVTHILVRKQ